MSPSKNFIFCLAAYLFFYLKYWHKLHFTSSILIIDVLGVPPLVIVIERIGIGLNGVVEDVMELKEKVDQKNGVNY